MILVFRAQQLVGVMTERSSYKTGHFRRFQLESKGFRTGS